MDRVYNKTYKEALFTRAVTLIIQVPQAIARGTRIYTSDYHFAGLKDTWMKFPCPSTVCMRATTASDVTVFTAAS